MGKGIKLSSKVVCFYGFFFKDILSEICTFFIDNLYLISKLNLTYDFVLIFHTLFT